MASRLTKLVKVVQHRIPAPPFRRLIRDSTGRPGLGATAHKKPTAFPSKFGRGWLNTAPAPKGPHPFHMTDLVTDLRRLRIQLVTGYLPQLDSTTSDHSHNKGSDNGTRATKRSEAATATVQVALPPTEHDHGHRLKYAVLDPPLPVEPRLAWGRCDERCGGQAITDDGALLPWQIYHRLPLICEGLRAIPTNCWQGIRGVSAPHSNEFHQ